jgi:hypothetical protein
VFVQVCPTVPRSWRRMNSMAPGNVVPMYPRGSVKSSQVKSALNPRICEITNMYSSVRYRYGIVPRCVFIGPVTEGHTFGMFTAFRSQHLD